MKLLDLYCGGGMAADGYTMAGFKVEGYDLSPQPNYPFKFTQADAIAVLKSDVPESFDAIHTSPPCQLFTRAKHLRDAQGSKSKETIDLLTPTMELLRTKWAHKLWIVENVEPAKTLMQPREGESLVRLCGSAFRLGVQRHRMFLTNFAARSTDCQHNRFPVDPNSGKPRPWGVYHVPKDNIPQGGRTARTVEQGREVMGVWRPLPWNTLKEGFPPAYTAHVGADLRVALDAAVFV